MRLRAFEVRPLTDNRRPWVREVLALRFNGPRMVTRGRVVDASVLPGFVAVRNREPIGLVTYEIVGDQCEIVALVSAAENLGVGTELLDAVVGAARRADCVRLWLVTTNDNTGALRFWQKRDFRIAAVHRESMEAARLLKPEIPLSGADGIPIRDEIELELPLPKRAAAPKAAPAG